MKDIWVLLVTTTDGHDSPDSISLHLTAKDAIKQVETEDKDYYSKQETPEPIEWLYDPDGYAYHGEGLLYRYQISHHPIPDATS